METTPLIRRLIARPEFGPFVLLVLELVVFWSINHDFLSPLNISNTLTFTVELGLIALAMTLLMTSGEFDLSVGSVFGFSPVVMWTLFNQGVVSLFVGFLIAMVIAAFVGLVNGLFVTRLKIPSFLVTLGMLLVVRGTALFVTNGFPQRTWNAGDQWLADVLVADFYVGPFRIYVSLFWFIAAALILGYVLTQTKFGNWIQASGGNASAATRARRQGRRAPRSRCSCSPRRCPPSPAIISSIRTSAANPNSGTGYELEVIAMVVIGGTALTGGRGTIIGTVLGILILRIMRNGIVLIGVPGLAYNIFIGAIILGMMALHYGLERRHQRGDIERWPKSSSAWSTSPSSTAAFRRSTTSTSRVSQSEIVGLLGDNGAGKSTLIKILSGAVPATSGDIYMRGRKADIRSTTDAIELGIETIYQDFALVTAALDRAQPLSWPRTGDGAALSQPHGPGHDERGGTQPAAGASASPRTYRRPRRSAPFPAANARRLPSPGRCISTAT